MWIIWDSSLYVCINKTTAYAGLIKFTLKRKKYDTFKITFYIFAMRNLFHLELYSWDLPWENLTFPICKISNGKIEDIIYFCSKFLITKNNLFLSIYLYRYINYINDCFHHQNILNKYYITIFMNCIQYCNIFFSH